jgi:transcriptional regulator with XRE-family HTH domain
MNSEISMAEIGYHLRQIRKQQGLTLNQVETRSGGNWKAVVVGSYERNDRTLSLKRAIELASFYQIPLQELLGLPATQKPQTPANVILDLRKISDRAKHDGTNTLIHHFTQLICAKRRDWNGEVLSLRLSDLTTLALILFTTEPQALELLDLRGFLLKASRR